MSEVDLSRLLAAHGVRGPDVERLCGGEKNDNYLVSTDGQRYVARVYARSTPEEVRYELEASEFLAAQGFPTPTPLRTADSDLWTTIVGRPAAMFEFATGVHPVNAHADFGLGLEAAELAATMHVLTNDRTFGGRRDAGRDPLRTIDAFLAGPHSDLPTLAPAMERLRAHAEKMRQIYRHPADLRHGLVHNDISPENLLVDKDSGRIVAVLDFDDCVDSFLLYDLGRIAETWGRTPTGEADRVAIEQLVAAYGKTRALTDREQALAIDFLATYAAATGTHVLGNKLRSGAPVRDPRESDSMALFLDLTDSAH